MPSEVSNCINNDIKLPLPVNGHEYRKPEAVNILSSYKKGSKSIGLAMKKIIQLKSVPVCVRSLRQLVEMAMNGKPVLDTDWTGAGRPPLATIDEIKSIAENMEYQSGRTILPDDVSKILSDQHMMKIKDAGFVSLDSPKFSSSTKRNYLAMIANQSNVSILQTSIIKTTTQFAAENSIVSATLPSLVQPISFLCKMKILIVGPK
jgi:hypothetical protein